MLDHISYSVTDFQKSVKFYDETLKLLGVSRLMMFETDEDQVAGYGKDNKPQFWIGVDNHSDNQELVGKSRGFHIAFSAPSVEAIHLWYQKCLELGGKDNGLPGPRPEYHEGYYGAFIIDPNGWRIEAVLHDYKT